MSNGMTFDWDRAAVRVRVPVDNGTTGVEMREAELPLATFARLLLTSIPEANPLNVVSGDLPLFVPYPPVDEVEATVRRRFGPPR